MSLAITPNRGLTTSLLNQRERNTRNTGQAIERLSTGKRINRPSDDPSGFVAAEQLRSELTVLKAELKSFEQQELSVNQQSSRLLSVQRQLLDLRGQIVGSAGNLLGAEERQALQETVDASLESIQRLGQEQSPGGIEELATGGAANLVDGDAALAQAVVDGASRSTTVALAQAAADQRGLEIDQRLREDRIVITTEALSQIEDADFAAEASNLATSQLLTKAADAALIYSRNAHAETIGQLLDEVDLPSRRSNGED